LAQTGNVATGVIDVIADFATGIDKIYLDYSGVWGGWAEPGIGHPDYTSAYNHATERFTVQNVAYIVEAYGLDGLNGVPGQWTSVLFSRSDFGSNNPVPSGAIQIGTVGLYTTSANALAAVVRSDVIGNI
jgi:hypothetical protein